MNKISAVYRIVCVPTGTVYIGGSTNIANRWSKHLCDLRKGRHTNPNLQAAWLTHGASAFSFEIIEIVNGLDALRDAEQFALDACDNKFNVNQNSRSCIGRKHSDAFKAAVSERMRGERNPWYGKRPTGADAPRSAQTRAKLSEGKKGDKNPMYGVRGPLSKLSDDNVRTIRARLAEGVSSEALALVFNVSKGAIQHIKKGRSYKDVI